MNYPVYNLRPNKYVERSLFIELLSILCDGKAEDYVYVSLAGPLLEDQRLVHYHLGFKKLVSIEKNDLILKRQKFNLRPGCIECRNESIESFIANFPEFEEKYNDESFVFWLDYDSSRERNNQLKEFESLVSKMNSGDIIKITINANVGTLGESAQKGETPNDFRERRYNKMIEELDEYFDSELFEVTDVNKTGFVKIMRRAIDLAARKGMARDLNLLPVLSFHYQDGRHTMLNVAYLFLSKSYDINHKAEEIAHRWNFIPSDSNESKLIDIPDLSTKERLFLDGKVFTKELNEIHKELPFKFHIDDERSLDILKQYYKHYRKYPDYLNVSI